MPTLSDATLKAYYLACKRDTAPPADLDTLVAACNADAKNVIFEELLGLGYSYSQVEGWDRFAEFNRRIGLALLNLDGREENADTLTEGGRELAKWRDMLRGVRMLMIGGRRIDPAGAAVRRWGVMSNAGAMFAVPRRLFGPNALPADTAGVSADDAAAGLTDAGVGLTDGGLVLTDGG